MARKTAPDGDPPSAFQDATDLYEVETLAEMPPDQLLDLYGTEALDRIEASAPVGHWTIDLEGGQMVWSRGLQRLLGTDGVRQWETTEELRRIVHPEDREAFDTALQQVLVDREPFHVQHRMSLPNGGTVRVRSAGGVQSDPEGQAGRIFGITLQLERLAQEG